MLYGSPAWDIAGDSTDIIGIRTLTLSKFWQASTWLPTSTDPQLDPNFPATPPPVSGGILLIGQETRKQGGGLKTFWTFEGINGNGRAVTFKGRNNSLDYEFNPGFSQVSIQLLQVPNFQTLLAQYGGSVINGSVVWPSTLPPGSASGPGLGGAGSQNQNNPMFGVEDFLRLEGTYHFRYASFSKPVDAGMGTVLGSGSLPGNAPDYSDSGRNWLMAPSPYKRRGPVYEITEIYWLSGPGGWPTPIYGSGSSSGANGFGQNSIGNPIADAGDIAAGLGLSGQGVFL